MNMEFFDADNNYIGPGADASDEALKRADRLYREGLRRQKTAGERVAYGDNRHHREFTEICAGRIYYDAGLVPLENLGRATRDEIGGKVNLLSMMRDFISLGGSVPPPIDDKNAIITRALSSSDFPNLMSTVVNKSLVAGYDQAPECWPAFTKTVPVNDFKNADFILGGSMSTPPEVVERGELHQATLLDDGMESDYIRTHVHRVTISRQALLNSDTNALATLPFQNGIAVSRAIGNAVFSLLTTNAALGDGSRPVPCRSWQPRCHWRSAIRHGAGERIQSHGRPAERRWRISELQAALCHRRAHLHRHPGCASRRRRIPATMASLTAPSSR